MNKELLGYALRLLNRKDYTEKEIREKLTKRAAKESDANEVITYLKEKGFISDERYAENYVFFRLKKGYGLRRIRYELLKKGVDEAVVEKFLKNDRNNLEKIFLKRLKQLKGKKNIRSKLFDYMYRRGFESEEILELLNRYEVIDDENG